MTIAAEMSKGREQSIIEGKKVIVLELIDSAYDLSDGIGCQLYAVTSLTKGRDLSSKEKEILEKEDSGFLNNRYTADWRKGRIGLITNCGPHKLSSSSNDNLELFDVTGMAYERIKAKGSRIVPRGEMLQAATLKLGCMLGVLEQLTFDAEELGIPVSADYKPSPLGYWEPAWQTAFGEELPDLDSLYKKGRMMFVTNTGLGRSHIQHLLFMPKLLHLKGT